MKKVRKVTKYKALVGDNEEITHEFKSAYQDFDTNKNCTKEVDYTSSGEIETASGYKFDELNRMIEEIHYFGEEEIGEVVKYTLNDDGKPLEIETTYADGSISLKKTVQTKNSFSVKSFDEDGEPEGEELVKYNDDGKIVEQITYDEDHSISQRSVYTYNDQQQVESKTNYGVKEEFLVKAVYEYDNNGNVTREIQLSRKGKLINQIAYSFNKNNELISWENNRYSRSMKYDEEGRLIYEETRNRGNNMVEDFTEYMFDENGLLVEEKSFEMGEQYQMQPGVMARSKMNFIVTRHDYEFYED